MIKKLAQYSLILAFAVACSDHNSESEISIPSAQKEPLTTGQSMLKLIRKP